VKAGWKIAVLILGLWLLLQAGRAQDATARLRSQQSRAGKGKDTSLQHRTGLEDSITISYRYLDSSRLQKFDTTVYDFSRRYPLPNTYIDLGNFGTAARDLVFAPTMSPGWDPGWHAYDIYAFTAEETRFYTSTRPYSELGYLLGSKTEQLINLLHTQNINPNWNFSFQYRLINSPGTFPNQNTNHNNYRFSSWYQGKNRRYQAFLILVGNKLQSSDNGGLSNPSDIDSNTYTNQSTLPTQLGPNSLYSTNFFSSNLTTGTQNNSGNYVLRQQYDLIGIKDSIVTDSTVIPLFYPKFRVENTTLLGTYSYQFMDQNPDSTFYVHHYDFISTPDTLSLRDYWKEWSTDLSLYQFPDGKNAQQFLKAGVTLQGLKGYFYAGTISLYNVIAHGEYRNRTRNQKWDIEANGKLYLNGSNAGDYSAYISLRRLISKNLGYLQLGFRNVNRTPSFAFDRESSFGFGVPGNFKKENNTNFFGSIDNPREGLRLTASYYLINNYSYFQNYYQAAQQTNPFNLLQLSGEKRVVVYRNWIWRIYLILQQTAGNSPLHLPLLVTHNQIGYEGKLGYKNLGISFGLEFRYYTAYKADGYSPLIGQFFIQNSTTVAEKLPDITAYAHFRIRSFTAYVRAENLNTAQIGSNGFGFTNYNFNTPDYPSPGLRLRLGIFWSFVN
jgi:hypothetical protein